SNRDHALRAWPRVPDGGSLPSKCGMALQEGNPARRHARILISAKGATIEDLGSKNGTFLRGQRLTGLAELQDGDEIRLGSLMLTFQVSSPVRSTETYAGPRSEP